MIKVLTVMMTVQSTDSVFSSRATW